MPKRLWATMLPGISSSETYGGLRWPAGFAGFLQFLAIHLQEDVEGHEAEVHRATAGIEKADVANGLGRALPGGHRNEVTELIPQTAVGVHLHPEASERVLDKETDDPAYGEQLRDGRDVRGLELLLRLPRGGERVLEFLGIKCLIQPTDSFLIAGLPSVGEAGRVDGFDDFFKHAGPRAEPAGEIGRIEKD